MAVLPAFGVQLVRLAEMRGLDIGSLARLAALPESELGPVLGGAKPGPSLLRRLAPTLDLHTSDLFVIADRPVPEDLAPLDATAADRLDGLAWSLTYLPRAVPELHQLIRSMPQQPRPEPPPLPRAYQQYPRGVGGLVLRLLHNRNLDWRGSAKYLFGLAARACCPRR